MLVDFFTFLIGVFPFLGGISSAPVKTEPSPQKAALVLTQQDFRHTFSYQVSHGKNAMNCQATRINARWFVTAAHCVKDICKNSCTIKMDLMDTAVSVLARGTHSAYHYTVFVHPGYKKTQAVKDDFALIRLDVKTAPKTYFRRSEKGNVGISARQFFTLLRKQPNLWRKYQALFRFEKPVIVDFEGGDYEIMRTLSVVAITNAKRVIKQNSSPVYYVKNLGYAYTQDFGIRKGMSGSGVISEKRELVGIISANIKENYFNGAQKVAEKNWFMFPVFNEEVIAFMQAVMGKEFNTLKIKKAYPSVVRKTQKDFSSISQVMERALPGK